MPKQSEPTTKWRVDISEFKAAMSEASRAIKLANSEFKAATAGAEDWASSTDGLTAKIKSLQAIEDAQKRQLEALQTEYKRVAEAQGEDSAQAQNLQVRINNQTAAIKNTHAEINKYTSALDSAGEETEELAESTEKSSEGFTVLKGALADLAAKAVTEGVKALATAFVDLANAIKDAALEAAQYADDISTQAVVTGLSTDALQEYAYMAGLVDVEVSTLTGALAKLTRNMAGAKDGTGTAAEAFAELGVEITNTDGSLRSNQDVFAEVLDTLGKMTNETERDAAAMALFGKSAQDLNPLILAGSDKIAEFADEAHRVGYVLSEDALGGLGDMQDSLDRLTSTFDGLKRGLVSVFAPIINDILTPITAAFQRIAQAYAEGGLSGMFRQTVTEVKAMVKDMVPMILDMIPEIVRGIGEADREISKAGWEIIGYIVEQIPAWTEKITEALPTMIEEIIHTWYANEQTLIEGFTKVIEGLAEAIPLAMPVIEDALPLIIQTLTECLIKFLPDLIDAAIVLFTAIIDAIPLIIPPLVAAIPEITFAVTKGLMDASPAFLKAAKDSLMAIVYGLGEVAIDFWEMLQKIPQMVTDTINGMSDGGKAAAFGVGEDIVNALWKGIQHLSQWLTEQVSGFVSGIVDTIMAPIRNLGGSAASALSPTTAGGTQTGGVVGTITGAAQTVFNQVINSPRALSASEIYQQTNSLLFANQVAG